MIRVFLALCLLIPAPARALEICDDLWFTRNLVFHQAGYCFGSNLGKAVFGNAGCTTKSPSLNKNAARIVARVKEVEREWECRLNTTRRSLGVRNLAARKALQDLPIGTGYESGCIGWQEGPVLLRDGRSDSARPIAEIRTGDSLHFQFEPAGDWEFIEVYRNDTYVGMGWARMNLGHIKCEMYAG